ncbi:MAG: HAMP domain-containing histidine kinase [Chloroflexi bacterium]|nr:HAMP domain-containing histidine kinase [Chloroflexota bacterium]
MIHRPRSGIAVRIAAAALASVALAVGIVAAGVAMVGGEMFIQEMVAGGDSADHARQMYGYTVIGVLVAAVLVAAAASLILAVVLARWLARPLSEVGAAARRVAEGDYAARVPREGPEELANLADSFNQMAESLQEQERMRRDFIANAAHELRTPLTNLQGYLEALRDGVITADRATYESLWEEADRLVRLARSLDDLAEGDRIGRPARVVELDLAPVLASAVELARPALEARSIRLERSWPERLPARADPDHVAQVLANLLQNAVRYSAAGSRVAITADPRPGSVLVTVANDGQPIPAGDLPHVFERFYRVDKSRDRDRGGAGIGLAIVKQLVEAAGGRVGAESGPGGTRFWFSIPSERPGH